MKTASRVVGTAALLDGFIAQDSPVYGAERRGAPLTAHTRIARETILERGVIANPDLVVVADDTLLDDPSVEPLTGTSSEGVLLLSSAHSPDELREHTGYQGVIEARDLLALALEQVGSAAGVSTALAAAACKLLGLSDGSTEEALKKELPQIGLDPQVVKASLRLAERARVGFEPIEISPPTRSGRPPRSTVVDVTYAPPEIGTPSVAAPANTPLRRTGNWRVFTPVIDLSKCTQCWICFVRCPDGAILLDSFENPHVDYGVCKGCLICVEECPTHAIAKVREVREWVEAGFDR